MLITKHLVEVNYKGDNAKYTKTITTYGTKRKHLTIIFSVYQSQKRLLQRPSTTWLQLQISIPVVDFAFTLRIWDANWTLYDDDDYIWEQKCQCVLNFECVSDESTVNKRIAVLVVSLVCALLRRRYVLSLPPFPITLPLYLLKLLPLQQIQHGMGNRHGCGHGCSG